MAHNFQVGQQVLVTQNLTRDTAENYTGQQGEVLSIDVGNELGHHDLAGPLPYRVRLPGIRKLVAFAEEELKTIWKQFAKKP